jgi:DNA/RNA endonuclease YhcR with UshA esterase domain
MRHTAIGVGFAAVILASAAFAEEEKPLSPTEARKQVGKEIIVQMEVRAAKNRLERRGEIYLDAEDDFRDSKNFAIVITKKGAAKFKEAGIDDPAEHFRGKIVRAKGTVKEVQEVPRIEIDDPAQLKIVEKK